MTETVSSQRVEFFTRGPLLPKTLHQVAGLTTRNINTVNPNLRFTEALHFPKFHIFQMSCYSRTHPPISLIGTRNPLFVRQVFEPRLAPNKGLRCAGRRLNRPDPALRDRARALFSKDANVGLFKKSRSNRRAFAAIPAAYVQKLEPKQMLAGNVLVTVNPARTILRVIGDNANNNIDISFNLATNQFVITPTDGTTTINGRDSVVKSFGTVKPSIRLRLQDGNDSVTGNLTLANPGNRDQRIIDQGFFRMGRGNDRVNLTVDFVTTLTVIGDSGNDDIRITGSNFASDADVATTQNRIRAGLDDVIAAEPRLEDPVLRILAFDGDDNIVVSNSDLLGVTLVEGGNQNDTIQFVGTDLIGPSRFDAGTGHDDVFLATSTQSFGRLVFKGRTGNDRLLMKQFTYDYAGEDLQPFRYDGDTGNDVMSLDTATISLMKGARTPGTNALVTQPSGALFYIGGVGADRIYLRNTDLIAGGIEFDQGPDSDTLVVDKSTIETASRGLPGGVRTRGGGRLFVRGRGGSEAIALRDSEITTTGRLIIDGDANNDTIVTHDVVITAGADSLIETNFGQDNLAISGGSITAQANINVLLGEDDDDILVVNAPTFATTAQMTLDGGSGNDDLSFDLRSTRPSNVVISSLENRLASRTALSAKISSLLAVRATSHAADPLGFLFQKIADELP